ncbi:uncharacterized protein LOC135808264 [Sycon ciliatum]|uniref:uncharacterized protein LOC135808264 n=1 Tax=Sycon ciliatum TaxID=27933 RepID=UPI0020ADF87D|eukprot:scpid87080/ scgid20269/ 
MAGNLKAEIEAANVNFMRCFDGGDFDGLSMLYTEDCKLMPTGSATLIGREGVKAVFSSAYNGGAKKVQLTVAEVGELDANFEMAYERSQYIFFKEDGTEADRGKYVVIWKKVEGKWYLYTDIFNTDLK